MHALSRRLALFLLAAGPSWGQSASGGSGDRIEVDMPWARASAGQSDTAAAYFSLRTQGTADRLIGISTPAARMAELHRSSMENGIMRMLPVEAIDIGAVPTTLAPGGLHVMLMGLARPLRAGENFPLTLRFAHAPAQTVTVRVLPAGAPGPAFMHHR